MTDLQALFFLFVALYLVECAAWVPRDALLFSSAIGKWFEALLPSRFAGNDRAGFVLRTPVPPLGLSFVVQPWPLSISPQGVLAHAAAGLDPARRISKEARFWRWEQIERVESEAKLLRINGEVAAACTSAAQASALRALIDSLRDASEGKRKAQIREALAATFDVEAVRKTVEQLRWRVFGVRVLANALWIEMMVLMPIALGILDLHVPVLQLGATLAVLLVSIAVTFFFAHRGTFRERPLERWLSTLQALIYPPSAMRAHDTVARDALAKFHPLGVAAALLKDDRFERWSGEALRDLIHPRPPLCPTEAEGAAQTEAWYRALLIEEAERAIKDRGLDPTALLSPPEPADKTLAYCPRCHSPYQVADGGCEDCSGLPLVPYAKAGTSPETTTPS